MRETSIRQTESKKNSLEKVLLKTGVLVSPALVLIAFVYVFQYRHSDGPVARATLSPARSLFEPTIVNSGTAPQSAPPGMLWIPGGEFSMGANDPPDMDEVGMKATADARPIHRVYVDGFLMDKIDVTNAQFAVFVKATNYVTVAERTPRAEDFPGAPPENLVAGSVVYSPPDHPVPLNNHFQWWSYVPGANWRHPLGPKSDIKGKEDYPVVHMPMKMLRLTRIGPASVCLLKLNGNSPRAEAGRVSPLSGAKSFA